MKGLSIAYVKSVIEKAMSGRITTGQAAAKLGISRQYVNRLEKKYSEKGESAFVHGNRGRERKWKTSKEDEDRIIELYKGTYEGLNFSHFLEKLNEKENISITYRPLHRILTGAGFRSPKGHRKRKKENVHPSRPRRENFGELVQIDASLHRWFGEGFPKATLHGAVDDATGMVLALWFDREETLSGYFHMMHQILTKHGIPEAFYADRRTIFEFRKLSEKGKTIDRDTHVQFKRMCMQLGIELITTSVSQAKGRIERLWGTLQSRLVAELAIRGIRTIEEANAFLPEFVADFNRRFALKPDMESSVFAPAPSPKEIDFYLSTEFQRTADNGSSFGFEGMRHQLVDEDGIVARIPPKTIIDIYVTRSGKRVAVFDGKLWALAEVEKRQAEPKPRPVGRPKYIPGPNHPWRKYVLKAKKE